MAKDIDLDKEVDALAAFLIKNKKLLILKIKDMVGYTIPLFPNVKYLNDFYEAIGKNFQIKTSVKDMLDILPFFYPFHGTYQSINNLGVLHCEPYEEYEYMKKFELIRNEDFYNIKFASLDELKNLYLANNLSDFTYSLVLKYKKECGLE